MLVPLVVEFTFKSDAQGDPLITGMIILTMAFHHTHLLKMTSPGRG